MKVQIFLLLSFLGATISATAAAWPLEGKVVYYGPTTISERCLVPAHLYNFDGNASFSCDRFPQNQIFRFTEAIAGTKVELNFHGEIVTGTWSSDNRNLENDEVSEVLLDGKVFLRKVPFGGKYDEGKIIGIRKGKLIRAKANSEGHAPDLGQIGIELIELIDGIEWRQVQHPKQPIGFMPERERLLLSLESWQVSNDERNLPVRLGPCPLTGDKFAAPAVGCVPTKPALRDKAAQRP